MSTIAPEVFATSRLMDFFGEDALQSEIGYGKEDWPLAVLKELTENALDACEQAEVVPEITVKVDSAGITVIDNGPGLAPETVRSILDYSVRVSSRAGYVQPSRGRQGNALKCLVALPFVLDGNEGSVTIQSKQVCHEITVGLDRINQKPEIEHQEHQDRNAKTGTSVTIRWPDSARSILDDAKDRFLQLATDYTLLNPHLTMTVDWHDDIQTTKATAPNWPKWLPSNRSSAHWYSLDRFERLVAACINQDQSNNRYRPLSDFIGLFDGMAASKKKKAVLHELGLQRANISVLRSTNGLNKELLQRLLALLKKQTKPVKPRALGVIGKNHLQKRFAELGADMDTFKYKQIQGSTNGIPWIVEAAFAYREGQDRLTVSGVNWAPAILDPFRELSASTSFNSILIEQRAGMYEPIIVLVNFTCAAVEYTDRGKSAISFSDLEKLTKSDLRFHQAESAPRENQIPSDSTGSAAAITTAILAVTKAWAKQRRAEERDQSRQRHRRQTLRRMRRKSFKDAMAEVIEPIYDFYTDGGEYPAYSRQLMYRARPKIQELTGKPLADQYFCQQLLPDYIAENPETTRDWDIVYDARGHFWEPHTGLIVPLGTLETRQYLDEAHTIDDCASLVPAIAACGEFPTRGPRNRFKAILFIEKEGFLPIFQSVHLAERYDIAITSSKGLSSTALRQLIDKMCHEYDVPLFVLHDFDKAGFAIAGTLQRDTRRYHFENKIEVIDIGVRLNDIEKWQLLDEEVVYGKSDPTANLRQNGATEDEIAFLYDRSRSDERKCVGRRVEINAFSNKDLIAFLEGKFADNGIEKLVPDEQILTAAFQREMAIQTANRQIQGLYMQAYQNAQRMKIPRGLSKGIRQRLRAEPTKSWDRALSDLVASRLRHAA